MSFFRYRAPWAPIMGFIGHNGAGKSALAVETQILQARRTGAPVYSNVEIRADGVDCREVTGFQQLLGVRSAHVFWDDVSAVAPARDSTSAVPAIVARLAALRHYDATLIWTAPDMMDVDIKIRNKTWSVCRATALRSVYVEGQLWPNSTIFTASTYDLRNDEAPTEITEKHKRISWGFRTLKSLPVYAYDTRAEIDLMADHAVCMDCGLPKRKEFCKGNHPETHSVGITSIASSNGREVLAVKPPGQISQHTLGAERVPVPDAVLGLDGADGGQ